MSNLRCSFCNRSQGEGVRVIAGPGVDICRECVSICNQILAEDSAGDQAQFGAPDRRFEENGGCALCGSNVRLEKMTSVPGCGRICSVCLEAVATILPASPAANRPNTRMQRTRSSASPPRSPLMRSPLGARK